MFTAQDGSKKQDRRRATEAQVQNTAQFILAIVGKYGVVAAIALIAVLFMGGVVYAGIDKMNTNLTKHMTEYNQDALVIRFMLREICGSLAKDESSRLRCYSTVEEIQRDMRR